MSSDTQVRCFGKPTWTLQEFFSALPELPGHLLRILPTMVDIPISGTLRERIMLAVAAVNQCWVCKTTHSLVGRVVGIPHSEIKQIIQQGQTADPQVADVLSYVCDMALRNFKGRDEAGYGQLRSYYSERQVAAIESSAHVINFANRFWNTFESLRVTTPRK